MEPIETKEGEKMKPFWDRCMKAMQEEKEARMQIFEKRDISKLPGWKNKVQELADALDSLETPEDKYQAYKDKYK